MEPLQFISCDNCGHEIQLENVIAKQMQKDFDDRIAMERKKMNAIYDRKNAELEDARLKFQENKAKENELFLERLNKAKIDLAQQLRKEAQADFKMQLALQKEELDKKRLEINALKSKEIEVERLKLKLDEQEKEIELKYIKQLKSQKAEMETQISKRVVEQNQMTILEKDKQLNDLKKQIEEMKRKAEQGSMQLQGEVQELAIEDFLKKAFPLDEIVEIKKGARGGDCIQKVNTRLSEGIGTIYYESKRTKEFSPSWIEKFKKDMREKSADLGVLVSSAMPKNVERMTLMEGVWVCTFEEFKALSAVLRESLIRIDQVRSSEENKGDKMHLLYDFLTGNEFRMHIEGIVEGFQQMNTDLQKEKNAMMRIWAQREKQIMKVIKNTTALYGGIKGIAGSAVQQIDYLELPDGDIGLLDE